VETPEKIALRAVIAGQYAASPVYGVRRMTATLRRQGYVVNRKRVARLYRQMGLHGIVGKRRLSARNVRHPVYPYLLGGLTASRPNHVWATDITYVRLGRRTMYVMAIIDHQSRYIVGWGLSQTLEADFCRRVLARALVTHGVPEIVNTDQGSQFTSAVFTQTLLAQGIVISMDSKGRRSTISSSNGCGRRSNMSACTFTTTDRRRNCPAGSQSSSCFTTRNVCISRSGTVLRRKCIMHSRTRIVLQKRQKWWRVDNRTMTVLHLSFYQQLSNFWGAL
jgi:hypothetical protein